MAPKKGKSFSITITDPLSQYGEHLLVVNGEILRESSAYKSPQGHLHAFLYSVDEAKSILDQKLETLKGVLASLYVAIPFPWNPVLNGVEFYFEEFHGGQPGTVRFKFDADGEEWRNPFSMTDYARSLAAAALSCGEGAVYFQNELEFLGNGFGLECDVDSMNATVRAEVDRWIHSVRRISDIAMELAMKTVRRDAVIAFFDFPPPVKAACQQYLIYFAQFLNDLGIKADSEIKEEAGRVLFSVVPKDGPAALGRIKEALEAYLDLPRNPEFNAAAEQFGDAAVAQLKANVFFLKSQLALSQAVLENKNATIEALSSTIFQQRQLISSASDDGGKTGAMKEADSEPILGDTVHLTKYEGKLLKVDVPKILRRLKRSFGMGNNKKESNRD